MPDLLYRDFLDGIEELPVKAKDYMVKNLIRKEMDTKYSLYFGDKESFRLYFFNRKHIFEEITEAYYVHKMTGATKEEFYKWADEVATKAARRGISFYRTEKGDQVWKYYVEELLEDGIIERYDDFCRDQLD